MDMPFDLSRCQSDCVSYMFLICEAEAAHSTHSPLGVMMRTAAGSPLQGLWLQLEPGAPLNGLSDDPGPDTGGNICWRKGGEFII